MTELDDYRENGLDIQPFLLQPFFDFNTLGC